ANILTGLLGIVLGPIEGTIGINCTPISVFGAGGTSCASQAVCCTNNQFVSRKRSIIASSNCNHSPFRTKNGLINLGCTPINVNI
ncbi:Hydrophobin-3, partial [Leucoagaricus sp. SymC.cos]